MVEKLAQKKNQIFTKNFISFFAKIVLNFTKCFNFRENFYSVFREKSCEISHFHEKNAK